MTDQLKLCPFCGCNAIRYSRANGDGAWQHEVDHWIACDSDDCLAHVGMCETQAEADALWNTRAALTVTPQPQCIHMTAEMAANCPTCNPSALRGLPTVTPQEAAKVSAEDRENIVDEIESIICETHEMDVRDIDYAENIVSWLERHHPAALRAISEDSQ